MSTAEHAQDISREVKRYITVFVGLLVLTVVTVVLNYLHFPLALAIFIALFVATVKASLVACFFMHLISERKLIYLILIFTFIFFVSMMGLFYAGYFNLPEGTSHVA